VLRRPALSAKPGLLFLLRKFAGTFMLCSRLRARVDLGAVFGDELVSAKTSA
jgi:hypothetical protein